MDQSKRKAGDGEDPFTSYREEVASSVPSSDDDADGLDVATVPEHSGLKSTHANVGQASFGSCRDKPSADESGDELDGFVHIPAHVGSEERGLKKSETWSAQQGTGRLPTSTQDIAVVVMKYTARQIHQLTINVGDHVNIRNRESDHTWIGELLSEPEQKLVGSFPACCVRALSDDDPVVQSYRESTVQTTADEIAEKLHQSAHANELSEMHSPRIPDNFQTDEEMNRIADARIAVLREKMYNKKDPNADEIERSLEKMKISIMTGLVQDQCELMKQNKTQTGIMQDTVSQARGIITREVIESSHPTGTTAHRSNTDRVPGQAVRVQTLLAFDVPSSRNDSQVPVVRQAPRSPDTIPPNQSSKCSLRTKTKTTSGSSKHSKKGIGNSKDPPEQLSTRSVDGDPEIGRPTGQVSDPDASRADALEETGAVRTLHAIKSGEIEETVNKKPSGQESDEGKSSKDDHVTQNKTDLGKDDSEANKERVMTQITDPDPASDAEAGTRDKRYHMASEQGKHETATKGMSEERHGDPAQTRGNHAAKYPRASGESSDCTQEDHIRIDGQDQAQPDVLAVSKTVNHNYMLRSARPKIYPEAAVIPDKDTGSTAGSVADMKETEAINKVTKEAGTSSRGRKEDSENIHGWKESGSARVVLKQSDEVESSGGVNPEVDPFSILVKNIGTDMTKDALELFFESPKYSGGGEIKELDYEPGDGTATITFEEDHVVRNILAKSEHHELVHERCRLSVHPLILNLSSDQEDIDPVDPRAVIVEDVSSTTSESTLTMFLENKKKGGGGEIIEIDYNPKEGLAKVIFEDEYAAMRILEKGDLQLDGSSLRVSRPQPDPSGQNRPSMPTKSQTANQGEKPRRLLDTVVIEVIKYSKITDFEKFLKISPEVGVDKLQHLELYLDRNMAVVRFKDHKDAQSLVERGSLSAHDLKLRVSPVDTSVADSGRYQGPLAIAVTNIKPDTKEQMIKLFFRNRAKSGGGEITALYWNPQIGRAVITFKAAQAVADVIEKHTLKTLRLAKCDLEITRMIPLPPPKLIQGLKDPSRAFIIEAPEVTPDELKRYIGSVHLVDQKQDQQPELIKVLYSFEGRTIMLEFCEDPDFLELGLLFATRPLDDHMMTLQRVARPTQVQVHNIQPSDDTEEMLELYFQDPSHGGDESVTVQQVDEKQKYAILQCSSPAVVDSVTRRSHTIFDHTVHVAVYYPEFGVIPPNYNASKPWNFNPAPYRHSLDPDPQTAAYMMMYVIDVKDVSDVLAGVGRKHKLFEIDQMDSSPEGLMVKCHPDYKPSAGSKSWEELCRHELDALLSNIDVVGIPSSKESLDELCQYASKLFEHKSVLIHIEKKVAALTVIGWKSHVAPLQGTLNKTSKMLQDVAFRRNNAAEESVRLKSHQAALLRARNFEEVMKHKIPNLEVHFTSNQDLLLKGLPAEVKNATQLIEQQIHQITSRQVSLRPDRSSLFENKEIKKAVFSRFDQENIKGVLEVSKSGVTVHAMTRDEVQCALKIVDTMITEQIVTLHRENVPVLHSPAWEALQIHVLEKLNGLFEIKTDTRYMKITIFGLSDICDEVCQMVKDCIEENTLLDHFLPLPAGQIRLLDELRRTDFDKLTSHRKSCSVSCEARDQPGKSGYMVTGCKRDVQDILPKIEELISEVLTHDHVICNTGMPKYFASEKGQDLLKSLEIKHQSVCEVVRVSSASEAGVQELYKVETEGGYTVRVIRGDITKLKVDAIVNAANSDLDHIGGLAAAILQAGGDAIQQECHAHVRRNGSVLPGDVFLGRQTGRLPCKFVIHAVGPRYATHGSNHNKANELYTAVWRGLDAASSEEMQSIALPALSTGIFNYPLKEATDTICEAILDFVLKHKSTVKEICLVDLLSQTTKMFRQSLEQWIRKKNVKIAGSSHRAGLGEASSAFPSHISTAEYQETDRERTIQPGGHTVAPGAGFHAEVQTPADGWRKGPKPEILMTPQGLMVQLKKSTIAKEKVDVIVNTSNTGLDLRYGAVSQSLVKAGGHSIQTECRSVAPGGINFGGVIKTSAGNIKDVKAIYHGACVEWATGQEYSSKILKEFVTNCLAQADMDGFTSIAFPAVGTGNLKFPHHLVSQYMFDVFWEFSKTYWRTSVKDIRVILYEKDKPIIQAFETHKAMLLNPPSPSVRPREQRRLKSSAPTAETGQGLGKGEGLTFKHQTVTIVVKSGDITEETTDAILNSTNSTVSLDTGQVSSCILKKGGNKIKKEWEKKMKDGGYCRDKPIITTAGNLQCKHIIHADPQAHRDLEKIIKNILQFADLHRITSLALPGLGLLYKSPTDVAKLMLGAIMKFASDQNPQYLELIHITLFDRDVFTAFKKETEAINRKTELRFIDKITESAKGVMGSVMNLVSGSKPAEPVEEVLPEDPVKTEPKAPTTCIRIYSLSQHNIDAVVRRLDDCCEDETATKFIDSPEEQETINKLDSQTMVQIFELGNTYGVTIDIEKTGQLKRIRVSGAVRDAVRCQKEIKKVLQNMKDEEEELTQQEDQMATRVQWEYRDNEGLHSYDKHNNLLLETAHTNNKPSVSWEENGNKFMVNFEKMIEIQIDRPGDELSIRRRDLKDAGSTSSASYAPYEESFPPDTETWQRGQYNDVRPKQTDPRYQTAPDTETWQRGQYDDVRPKQTDPRYQAGYNRSQSLTQPRTHKGDDYRDRVSPDPVDGKHQASRPKQVSHGPTGTQHWEPMQSHERYRMVALRPTDAEYQLVESNFRKTHSLNSIVKIERVQNPTLYKQYEAKRDFMDATNPKGHINEMTLYHGTSETPLRSINNAGFNRSYSGKNAMVIGNGVYFARDASYSAKNTYSPPNANGHKHVYQCKVLTGEYTKGSSGLVAPPPKDPRDPSVLYDSVTDRSGGEAYIFVIFNDTQAYPEYLITFT